MKRKNNTRNQYGLCECKLRGCTGICFAIADGNQHSRGIDRLIVPGTICLYLHSQKGTQGAQSDWIPLERLPILQLRNDSSNRQQCTICLQPAKENYYKFDRKAKLTVHKVCLDRILELSQAEKVEQCYLTSKKCKLSIALFNEDQRKQYCISLKSYEKACKDLQERKDLNLISEKLYVEWMDRAVIKYSLSDSEKILIEAPFYKEYNLQVNYVLTHGFVDRKVSGDYSMGLRHWEMLALGEKFLLDADLILLLKQRMSSLDGLSYRQFVNNYLEIYTEITYNKKLDLQTISLLLIEENVRIRTMAEEYLKRAA